MTQPGPFYRERQPWMTDDDAELPEVHPFVIASDQITAAMTAMDRPQAELTRWPFPDVDKIAAQMVPGNIWFVCAASGGGKTTFVASVIDHWRHAKKKLYVMPLETRAYEFRTHLACLAADVHPGDVLSGEIQSHPNYRAIREVLRGHFYEQTKSPYLDQVMVSGQRAINLAGLEAGLKEAKAFGADVVIVDHIDHIEGGEGSNLYAEAKRVNMGALRMAQDNDMLIVFTSQLNMQISRGDYLSRYVPPKEEHVAFGSLKRQVATGMLGLFRPVRSKREDETDDEYTKAIRSARAGEGQYTDALEPNTMGVVCMKNRPYGSREGHKAYLHVERGKVTDMPEKDRYTTGSGFVRKVV
jgi:DnaB-like helicase C terminal domain